MTTPWLNIIPGRSVSYSVDLNFPEHHHSTPYQCTPGFFQITESAIWYRDRFFKCGIMLVIESHMPQEKLCVLQVFPYSVLQDVIDVELLRVSRHK